MKRNGEPRTHRPAHSTAVPLSSRSLRRVRGAIDTGRSTQKGNFELEPTELVGVRYCGAVSIPALLGIFLPGSFGAGIGSAALGIVAEGVAPQPLSQQLLSQHLLRFIRARSRSIRLGLQQLLHESQQEAVVVEPQQLELEAQQLELEAQPLEQLVVPQLEPHELHSQHLSR